MNLSFENHCVSNSPSKLEGVGGSMSPHLISYHTPQSLRDSSSILEEQLDTQLIIFVELTLIITGNFQNTTIRSKTRYCVLLLDFTFSHSFSRCDYLAIAHKQCSAR